MATFTVAAAPSGVKCGNNRRVDGALSGRRIALRFSLANTQHSRVLHTGLFHRWLAQTPKNTRLRPRLAPGLRREFSFGKSALLHQYTAFFKNCGLASSYRNLLAGKNRNLRCRTALLDAVVNQGINFVGFVKNRIDTQLSAALANVVGGVVAEYHYLLKWIPAATSG